MHRFSRPISRPVSHAASRRSCRHSSQLALALSAGLLLAACDSANPDSAAAGAVSEGEAAALDEAAKVLDEKRLPEGALPDIDPPAQPQQSEQPEAGQT